MYWRLSAELAGFGGDVKFLRGDVEFSAAHTIRLLDLILAAGFSATAIKPKS